MAAPNLLNLPLELRLQIYAYALQYSPATVTVSTAQLQGQQADIIHRLYGEQRQPFHGIPHQHIPVIEPRYDPALLSITNSALVSATSPPRSEELGVCDYSPKLPLLLVNRQINAELNQYIPSARKQEISLFISYPSGLHVFDSIGSHLLRAATTVQIAGQYSNLSFSPTRAAKLSTQDVDSEKGPDIAAHLSTLISNLLGPTPRVAQLQLRIYYPGTSSYATVWGDDSSPTVVALRSIFAGEIEIEVSRGREGTGVFLVARPSADNKRSVSTVWRRLNEGGRPGEKEVGSWVVNPAWPSTTWTPQSEVVSGEYASRDVVVAE